MKALLAAILTFSALSASAAVSIPYSARAVAVFRKAVQSGQLESAFRDAEALGLKRTQTVRSIRLGSSDIFGVHVEKHLVLLELAKGEDRIALGAIVEVSSDGDDKVISPVDLKKIEGLLLSTGA